VVWQNPTGGHLVDTAWELMEIDISSVSNGVSAIDIRFTLDSNATVNLGGWSIDDVEVFGLSDCVPAAIYGVATTGSGGLNPTINTFGEPRVGSTNFGLSGGTMLGGAQAYLAVGFAPTSVSAIGLTLLVNPIAVTIPATTTGGAGVPGVGTVTVPLNVPADPSLDNIDVFYQWFVTDPGSPSALFSASPGARSRICAN
jgi:hypothetical protein